ILPWSFAAAYPLKAQSIARRRRSQSSGHRGTLWRSVPAQDPSQKSLPRCRIGVVPIVLELQDQYQENVMSSYVDLVIIPVPEARLADYRRLAEVSAQVWREHGALSYVEIEADDAKPGKVTSFPQSVALEA